MPPLGPVPGNGSLAAMAIVTDIAANAPLAVQSIKRTIDAFAYRGLSEALEVRGAERLGGVRERRHAGGLCRQGQQEQAEFEGK